MISLRWGRNLIAALIVNALIDPTYLFAQSQPSPAPTDQPGRVSIAYVPPETASLQAVYDLLREHHALERIQEILSPLRSPEQKRVLESLPSETNSDGLTPADAAVGQFIWVTLHEVGHAGAGYGLASALGIGTSSAKII
jgi:hypothetical protein